MPALLPTNRVPLGDILSADINAIAAAINDVNFPAIVSKAASFTFAASDMGKYVHASSASAIVATVPPNSSVAIDVGSFVPLARMGAGTVTVAAGAGVTIRSAGGLLAVSAQYAEVGLRKIATDEWLLTGSLS